MNNVHLFLTLVSTCVMLVKYKKHRIKKRIRAFPLRETYPEVDAWFNTQFQNIQTEFLHHNRQDMWCEYSTLPEERPKWSDISVQEREAIMQKKISSTGFKRWKLCGLVLEGNELEEAKYWPRTIKSLRSFPPNLLINAAFSCLEGFASTGRHKDNDHRYYRCHFPIVLPPDHKRAWIESDCGRKYWKHGQWFILSDTEYHNAKNTSKFDRIVLLVDVARKSNQIKNSNF